MLDIHKLSYWERENFFEGIDHLIIGAGIVGYSTALHLKELHPDAKIVIIERGYLPSGASSKNAGFACFGSPSELLDDIQQFGAEKVWETVELRHRGLEYLKALLGEDAIDLQINGSWDLFTTNEMDRFEEIKSQLPSFNAALERITGEKEVYSVDMETANKFGFKNIHAGFYNRLEGQINTGKMNKAFYQLVISKGIEVLFGIEASAVKSVKNGANVSTAIGVMHAKNVAICTNGFAKQLLPNEDIAPARAQVLITKPIEGLKNQGDIPLSGRILLLQKY